jgi:benzoyl-CoA 2,3-dioxygenase component B
MLTEEAHHLFVGETGVERVVQRSADLVRAHGDADLFAQGGIPLDVLQRYVNLWYSLSLDLFGGEVSSNAADYFATGLKGRWKEDRFEDHSALSGTYPMPLVRDGRVTTEDVPLRNAMNEVLRDAYVQDCERALARWNKVLEDASLSHRLRLPDRKFHRHIGQYADHLFTPEGDLVDAETWERSRSVWLPTDEDQARVRALMGPVHEPGQIASWIAPPRRGINGKPFDFEYVRFA